MSSDWMDDAACAGTGAWWDALTVAEQQAMCADCPVAAQCLAWAESFDAADTVFGGKYFPRHSRLRFIDACWTAAEDQIVLAHAPVAAAKKLDRTAAACATRRSRLTARAAA